MSIARGRAAARRGALAASCGWILCAALGAFPPSVRAQATPKSETAVSVRAAAEPGEVQIGDPVRYTVDVLATTEAEIVLPVLSGSIGEFTITDFGELPPRREDGRLLMSRWYTLTTFTTGEHFIPAPKVAYRTPGEELREAEGEEVLVRVLSLLGTETDAEDIRDVKAPESLPFDWRPYAIFALALGLAGALLAGFFYALNRPRRQRATPPRPPHERALAALNRLRSRHLIEAGEFDVYYVELSGIVRHYLEDGFSLRAPEMTTEEFLSALKTDVRLDGTQRRLLGEFLSQADLVKFARHRPTEGDAESAFEAARRLVEETRPRQKDAQSGEVRRAAA